MTTKYYHRADGSFVGAFIDADPPDGAIECEAPPKHAGAKMINGVWVEPDLTQEWRDSAETAQFCLALFRAGILSEPDAIAAAGGEGPAALIDLLNDLPAAEAAEARIVLASIAAHMSIDDAGLDVIFGLNGQEG